MNQLTTQGTNFNLVTYNINTLSASDEEGTFSPCCICCRSSCLACRRRERPASGSRLAPELDFSHSCCVAEDIGPGRGQAEAGIVRARRRGDVAKVRSRQIA